MKALYNPFTLAGLLTLLLTIPAFAQPQGSIRGIVTTRDGNPAAYVNIGLREIKRGTVTAEDGSYQLKNIPTGSYTLRITFVGLQPQEKNGGRSGRSGDRF